MNVPRYLIVDLTNSTVDQFPITEEYYRLYVGGKTLAARLLLDLVPPATDPLDSDNVIIINTGPLTGTGAPASGRFNITTQNVLAGGIATANCGGNFGIKMRRAGVDGLIIRGKAPAPVYIELTGGTAKIQSAQHLWGQDSQQTQEAFPEYYGKVVIGPAGENLVRYAAVISQERAAARCGVGAVMGSKNLKAVIAFGAKSIPVANPRRLAKINRRWLQWLGKHPITGDFMPRYGTMGFISKGGEKGVLPVKNFGGGTFSQTELLGGQHYSRNYLTRNYGCIACPIRCGRRQMMDGREIKGPEYETVGLMGPNMLNGDIQLIARWNHLADVMGLDTISLAGTLAFAMELKERGMADLGVGFDSLEQVEKIIEDIARRRNNGNELANGSRWLAEKYGGEDFAIQTRGMELPAYDPRQAVGLGLGYATSNRGGCHLNGGYMVYLEVMAPLAVDGRSTRGKVALTVVLQNFLEALSLSGLCAFTSLGLVPPVFSRLRPESWGTRFFSWLVTVSGCLLGLVIRRPGLLRFNIPRVYYPAALSAATGMKFRLGDFLRLGERSYNLERMFNIREGVAAPLDKLSRRLLKAGSQSESEGVPLEEMIPRYYKLRGWDEQGHPRPGHLSKLGIDC